jgi:hypothetical protein
MVVDPYGTLKSSFAVWGGLYAAAAVVFLLYGHVIFSVLCIVGSLGILCFWCAARQQLSFAAANLSSAAAALRVHPASLCVVASTMLISMCWSVVWSLGAVGVMESAVNEDLRGFLLALLLLSFYWGGTVVSNVSHVAVSGTVASWYFMPATHQDSSAAWKSLYRACIPSFGSIALGSLIVALLETTRSLLRTVRGNGGRCIACCVDCILAVIESWAVYINRYAFVYVAMYGDSFATSGSRVHDLFFRRGFLSKHKSCTYGTTLSAMTFFCFRRHDSERLDPFKVPRTGCSLHSAHHCCVCICAWPRDGFWAPKL